MAPPPQPNTANESSLPPLGGVDTVVRQQIDVGAMFAAPLVPTPRDPESRQENLEENNFATITVAATGGTTASPSMQQSKAQFSFRHKSLCGDKDLFLDKSARDAYNGAEDLVLVGNIEQCPNQKMNGGCYIISWTTTITGDPLPASFDPRWLRTVYKCDK